MSKKLLFFVMSLLKNNKIFLLFFCVKNFGVYNVFCLFLFAFFIHLIFAKESHSYNENNIKLSLEKEKICKESERSNQGYK